jgi:uncharacterized protein YkwD
MKRKYATRYVLAPLSVATLAVFGGIYSPATIALADPTFALGVGSAADGFKTAPGDRPDTDNDGLFDDDEVDIYGTLPNVADTDGDGSVDGEEIYLGTDPKVKNDAAARPDGDNDGLFDDDETNVYGTDPKVADTDKDGVADGEEVFNKTDPKVSNNGGANNGGGANNPGGGANNPGGGANNPGGGANNGAQPAGDFSGELFNLLNAKHTAAGCKGWTTNPQLASAAARHANDMVKAKLASDAHTGSDGSNIESRVNDSGYPAGKQAVNFAENVFSAPGLTPQSTVDGFMKSANHKAAIENCNYSEVGVSAISDGERMATVEVFGDPNGFANPNP